MFDIRVSYGCDRCFKKFDREEDINRVTVPVWQRVDGEPTVVNRPVIFCDACLKAQEASNESA